jgi:hypothetical protein
MINLGGLFHTKQPSCYSHFDKYPELDCKNCRIRTECEQESELQ